MAPGVPHQLRQLHELRQVPVDPTAGGAGRRGEGVAVMIVRRVGAPLIAAVALAAIFAAAGGCGGDAASDGPASTATTRAGTPTPATTATAGDSNGTSAPSSSPRTGSSPSRDDPSGALRASGWTSQPLRVEHNPAAVPTLVAVRSAHHEDMGFDRLVFEFEGSLPGYDARYVPEVVSPGAGAAVDLRGQAFMEVVFYPAAAHDDRGSSTMRTASGGGGLPGLHEYEMAGDYEGYVHYGLGIDDVVGFRVTEFARPSRIVIDIAA